MERIFISKLTVEKVRHLHDIAIPLVDGNGEPRHLILTGKNGSGKTSLLEALSVYLKNLAESESIRNYEIGIDSEREWLSRPDCSTEERIRSENNLREYLRMYGELTCGIRLDVVPSDAALHSAFSSGDFVLAYYKATRVFDAAIPKQIEKVEFKDTYDILAEPRRQFVKFLLDLKTTEAFARNKKNLDKADEIDRWFLKLQSVLRNIFDDDELTLDFNEDTFEFRIIQPGREPFDFNTLASGFAATLDIVVDLMMRMEKKSGRAFDFSIPGIVLIDEIETHLHLELQRRVMEILTGLFPNIQFVVTTHSPFILNSLENVVIYDLENRILVDEPQGMTDLPYDGIVEGYFKANLLSDDLQSKFREYKAIVDKDHLEDKDYERIPELEMYLDEVPDYLALGLSTEYKALKEELRARSGSNGQD